MLKFDDCAELNNGVKIPWLGFGVFEVPEGEEVIQSVLWALEAGYRSIDTAKIYRNEEGVGKAIKQSGIPRHELFITTKAWSNAPAYEATLRAFEESRRKLGLEYIDILFIHDCDVFTHGPEMQKVYYKQAMDGCYRALVELGDESPVYQAVKEMMEKVLG